MKDKKQMMTIEVMLSIVCLPIENNIILGKGSHKITLINLINDIKYTEKQTFNTINHSIINIIQDICSQL